MIRILLFLLLTPLSLMAQHLYVMHGRSAEISSDKFTLNDVDHSVVYFKEKEDQRAGSMPLREFLVKWESDKLFGQSGARAYYVSYIPWKTQFNEHALNLKYPKYNENEETLTFSIEKNLPKPTKLSEVTLFLIHE